MAMMAETEYRTVKLITRSSVPEHKNLAEHGMIAAILIRPEVTAGAGLETVRSDCRLSAQHGDTAHC